MRSVVVIGAGASGTLLAARLLLHPASDGLLVHLIERRPKVGRGVAYSTGSEGHLLNVPALNMSAFPEDLDHFSGWLRSGPMPGARPETFAPRRLYGDYLEGVLEDAALASGGTLKRVRGEAVRLEVSEERVRVTLADGRRLHAARAVLALGNFPPRNPPLGDPFFHRSPRYVADAWAPGALEAVPSGAPVLLIGTSLTAIDVAIGLEERGHADRIYAVSRRGLVPNPYRPDVISPPYPRFISPRDPEAASILGLFRRVREESECAARRGRDWHGVVEALRPVVQGLWSSLPENERRRFLRHVQPYWEVHRHRIAPEVGERVRAMREEGRLVVMAGRVRACREAGDGVEVGLSLRRGGARTLRVGCVINCTAPETDPRRVRHPLVTGLLAGGLARPGPLALGLDCGEEGELLDARGRPSRRLYTIGPLRKGRLWETIAVPEIREQAARLADVLLREDPVQRSAARLLPGLRKGGG
ncbi:hypothetical protein Rxycam_00864 [Rubrobacter xylanophilus DSM 9941]|uniref:FAD/NAD(P)-binding protein n=1 Tax=Rubrobacter xylanophilus TaxID=49319 RepID=UPI001C63D3BF|nr:FAD/NAD(P)-binding protein [Rubrobacter xylanophilus]QYJ15053.1 hypothetical protein Rxycam_00864 [Rubrobacter xylanophilus DSM 9941]